MINPTFRAEMMKDAELQQMLTQAELSLYRMTQRLMTAGQTDAEPLRNLQAELTLLVSKLRAEKWRRRTSVREEH